MPIVIGPSLQAAARFGLCRTVLFFFLAGLLLHFECVSIGSLSHPAGRSALSFHLGIERFARRERQVHPCTIGWLCARIVQRICWPSVCVCFGLFDCLAAGIRPSLS